MDTRKVSPGQPLRIPHATYNAMVEAAEAFRKQQINQEIGTSGISRNPANIRVRNTEETELGWFAAVALDVPYTLPSADEAGFLAGPGIDGYIADEDAVEESPQRIAILLSSAAAGAVVSAAVAGVVPCRVDITTAGDRYAALTDGETYLTSQASAGPVEIVWPVDPEGDTGEQWALVRLNGIASVTYTGALTVRRSSGSPSVSDVGTLSFNNNDAFSSNQFSVSNPSTGEALVKFAPFTTTTEIPIEKVVSQFVGGFRISYGTEHQMGLAIAPYPEFGNSITAVVGFSEGGSGGSSDVAVSSGHPFFGISKNNQWFLWGGLWEAFPVPVAAKSNDTGIPTFAVGESDVTVDGMRFVSGLYMSGNPTTGTFTGTVP